MVFQARRPLPFRLLRALRDSAADVARSVGDAEWRDSIRQEIGVARRAARKTLPWMWRARGQQDVSLLQMVLTHADTHPNGLAFELGDDQLTWRDLAEQTSDIAHFLDARGVRPGDVVAVLGGTSLRYIATIHGISRVGAVAALINCNVKGTALQHAVRASKARLGLADGAYLELLQTCELDEVVSFADMTTTKRTPFPRVATTAESDFVYIYTSGTTGLPKPCKVTHGRAVVAGASFGPLLFRFAPGDKLYCTLPLYHSSGLLLGVGSCIMTRTPMALREAFSASRFWEDVQRYQATAILYIGELCRYLLSTPPCEAERNNPVRVAVGNGLRADVWEAFAERFAIDEIREFYGATEAPGVVINFTGKVGSIGRIPLRRMGPMVLVRYDIETDEHPRDAAGRCIPCEPGETGELLVRLNAASKNAVAQFRGYAADEHATKKKILSDVFAPEDRYYRSGDLLRCDNNGYHYFVDRIGDTYRFKGENVSTAEVADVLSQALGVSEVTVVGVQMDGIEGRAGLAAIVCEGEPDLEAFAKVAADLPWYAQPRFVRVVTSMQTTATLKIRKVDLQRDGADPATVSDPLFVLQGDRYEPLTKELHRRIVAGEIRL